MAWKSCVLERKDIFFDKIWSWDQFFLERLDVFLTKYGHESSNFCVESRKKRPSYWLFWLIISLVLTDLTFLESNLGMIAEVFHEKMEEKWHESTVFLRENLFFCWQIMGMRVMYFIETGRSFTKYGHESKDFFVKIRKKELSSDFFGP